MDATSQASTLSRIIRRPLRFFRSSTKGRLTLVFVLLIWVSIGIFAGYEVARGFSWLAPYVYEITYEQALGVLWPLAGFVVAPIMMVCAISMYVGVMKSRA